MTAAAFAAVTGGPMLGIVSCVLVMSSDREMRSIAWALLSVWLLGVFALGLVHG